MARILKSSAFSHGPVTILTTLLYIAVLTAVIVTQTRVPSSPSSPTPIHGVNLSEAWNDLQLLSSQHHPFNSRQNDHVHDWLVTRIKEILADNKASSAAYIFEDNTSNLTFSTAGSTSSVSGVSVYFESTNIIVYVRGTEDDQSEWWTTRAAEPSKSNGVLVNAHYDSVSSGYGATDDGVGVISVLQLIRYYTTSGNAPRNGLVLLLNNGEEDFLNGANVFSQHFMSKMPSTFLNLEGAGAGGRAALFRSTDEEVTNAYARSPYPFGSVISADAFERGLVRSQTDYIVFNGKLGLRGLDVAFFGPRARYHTDQDDSRHTGRDAMWHMLSAAIATTSELTKSEALEKSGGQRAIWFHLFGEVFAVMRAHTFFALSVTVLVVGPILLFATIVILYRADKLYLLSSSKTYHTPDGDEKMPLGGWRGCFRHPFILVLSSAAPVALAYLIFKENPFIAHSSEWTVWLMMVSSFVFVAWFLARSIDFARPSALTRAYGLSWLCGLSWLLLIAAVVYEQNLHVSGGYFVLFYSLSVFLATWLSYLELSTLPKKSKYCLGKLEENDDTASRTRQDPRSPSDLNEASDPNATDDATEQTSLLRGRGRSVYKNYSRSMEEAEQSENDQKTQILRHEEQEWSQSMWTSLWILEFLIIIPFNLVILGQLSLYLVQALHQTGSDGSSIFLVYIGMAVLTILMFAPALPLLHRFTWHIPVILLFVLVGTLVFNLLAFPFSPQNRLKLFFQQEVDLDSGSNSVSLIGVPGYVQDAISNIPSAAGQKLNCTPGDTFSDRLKCAWVGPFPDVAESSQQMASKHPYKKWLKYNVTLIKNGTESRKARFVVSGQNTRACKLVFGSPIKAFHVLGQGPVDNRFPPVPGEAGSKEIRLWSRAWDKIWTVDVEWSVESNQQALSGKVVCEWSDVNQRGVIPAYDEALHFVPDWVAMTKAADGLVEGFKRFSI